MPSTLARFATALLLGGACTTGPLAEPTGNKIAPGTEDDLGDEADLDDDGIPTAEDNCPTTANSGQEDTDDDGVGNACDQCPSTFDPEQADEDEDGQGDACAVPDPCPGTDDDVCI